MPALLLLIARSRAARDAHAAARAWRPDGADPIGFGYGDAVARPTPALIAALIGWMFARTLLRGRRPLIARAIVAMDGPQMLARSGDRPLRAPADRDLGALSGRTGLDRRCCSRCAPGIGRERWPCAAGSTAVRRRDAAARGRDAAAGRVRVAPAAAAAGAAALVVGVSCAISLRAWPAAAGRIDARAHCLARESRDARSSAAADSNIAS